MTLLHLVCYSSLCEKSCKRFLMFRGQHQGSEVSYVCQFPNTTLFIYKFKLDIKIVSKNTEIMFIFVKLKQKGDSGTQSS